MQVWDGAVMEAVSVRFDDSAVSVPNPWRYKRLNDAQLRDEIDLCKCLAGLRKG